MENVPWNLEDFIDSLVVELDKTREILAIKAINKPLTYTVKDMSLDVNAFPTYDGDHIRFITAQSGQQGASKVTIQLGSITDQQVRATTKTVDNKGDITISEVGVDKKTKRQLRKMGVTSVDDLKKIENKNVDLRDATGDNIDFVKLQNQIEKLKRSKTPPRINSVSLSLDNDKLPYLNLKGEHLAVNPKFKPVVVINDTLAEVTKHDKNELKIKLSKENKISESNDLILTLDPYAIVKLNVKV